MHQDLTFALRTLARSRGFAAVAIVTLGLGMGANAIVFGVIDALLIRPLPFGDVSDRVVSVHSTHPTQAEYWDDSGISYPDLLDVRSAARTLEALEGLVERNLSISTASATERLRGASVTPGLFPMLNVEPQIGRGFRNEEGAPFGLETVVLISDGLWRRAFAGSGGVLGQPLMLNGRAVTVIGVMPPHFAFPDQRDVWLPLRLPFDVGRDRRSLLAFGVVRHGVDPGAARDELRSVAATLAARHPQTNRDWGFHVMPMRHLFVGEATRRSLGSLLVAVALVLLIGCANVASLFIARGLARRGELSIRLALGAGRAGLVRLLLAESVVLSLLGGGFGLLLAVWGLDALVASNPEPPPYWARVRLDGRLVAFVFLLSAVTALLCGLMPALRATRADVAGALQTGTRTAGSTVSQQRLQSALVISQVAVSFALLIGATLLTSSARQLRRAETGFDPRPLLSLRTYLAGDAYDDPVARARALDRVVDRIRALPGVAHAAATGAIPADDGGDGIRIVPPDGLAGEGDEIGAQQVPITRGFLETLGLTPVEGRSFTADEAWSPDGDGVLINQRLAARLWPGQSAVGRSLRLAGEPDAPRRVVGVVPNLVYEELGEETAQSQLTLYVPYVQLGWRTMALIVRAPSGPGALAASVRRAIREIDPVFAAFDVLTMEDRRTFTQWGEQFIGRTFALFAFAALLLVCVGTYGLTAYWAVQRTREIGLRLAVGARPVDIVRLLVGRGFRLAAIGLAAGVPLAAGGARLLEGLLFGVSAWEPVLWLMAPAALLAPVLLANVFPARRASLADPAEALRQA